ncbi:hypothetical protein ACNQ05_25280, partial [Enterobacter cloacae complex sp.6701062]|uniref:hypothetical protein n=1 Tax=Enterobacter cloacae complex sp.6701062 TaxID=3397177 RepID=UPI003AAF3096
DLIFHNARRVINKYLSNNPEASSESLQRFILDNVDYNFKRSSLNNVEAMIDGQMSTEQKLEFILEVLKNNLDKKKAKLNDDQAFAQFVKVCILKAIDVAW